MNDMQQRLKDISIADFAMVDLQLYLDTHPDDKTAMEYYKHYAGLKHRLSKEFAEKYYPLMPEYSTSCKEWNWVLSPMPWENDANPCMCKGGNV